MKQKLLLGFILFSFVSTAQLWFDIGLKGGLGAGFLNHKTIAKDSRLSPAPGLNNFYGGKLGVNFGEKHSFTIDGSFGGNQYKFIQSGISDIKKNYEYKIDFTAINLQLFYKKTNDAQYFEIGPEIFMLRSVVIVDQASSIVPIQNSLAKNVMGAVFGFGGYIIGNQTISLSMGLRFHYTFTDLTAKSLVSTNFPLTNYPEIIAHESSNLLAAQVLFELNYSLGQIAHASCGKRTAFIRL